VHRDLKPENVLIDRYRRWRVADFGIANIAGEETAGTSGTPAFAAPEQLLGENQDTTADLFSLAAVAYFVLRGSPPFGETDPKAILARMINGQLDVADLPSEIAEWMQRALAGDPSQRFADAESMQLAWRDAVRTVLDRYQEVPWWRRFFSAEHEGVV